MLEVWEGEPLFEQQERARCEASVAIWHTVLKRPPPRVEVAEVGDGRVEDEVELTQATGV